MPAVAPEIVFLSILFSVFALYVALLAATKGYQYTLGAVLRSLAIILNISLPIVGSLGLGKPIDALEHKIEAGLASGLAGLETVMGKFWHASAKLAEATFETVEYLAHSTLAAIHTLTHGTIPAAISGATRPLTHGLGRVGARMGALERTLETELVRRTRALEAEIERDFGKAWRGIDHLRGSLRGALAHVLGVAEADIAALRTYAHRVLNARLTRLEKLLGVGVISAVALSIVSRAFPWVRCTNVRNVARSLCRFPTGLLTALLADALEAAVLLNICEAVKIMSGTAEAFEPELRGLVVVTGAAIRCAGGDAPAPLDARGVALPETTAPASLPGV